MGPPDAAPPTRSPFKPLRIPAGIWALGFVSMLMDVSSEMIHALLPVYLVTMFGASMVTIGVIEGVAESAASITKIFSGALSDRLGKRKLLAAIGYGLAALAKPVFPLASSIGWLVAARFVDRVGKGIRGAPRDALVADLAPARLIGASFGLRQTLDTVGAFMGPLAAIGILWLSADNFRLVFWAAVLPAFLSFAIIVFVVREPARPVELRKVRAPLSPTELRGLGGPCWWVVGLAIVMTLARFSEAFLVLRALSVGLQILLVPTVMVAMNVAYAIVAYPAGRLSDRIDRITILAFGLGALVVADIVLAAAQGIAGVMVGVFLWGLHMGLTQGLLAALITDNSPPELRGTAFGVLNLASGVAVLAASVIAGILWDHFGPAGTFGAGAGFAVLAMAWLVAVRGQIATAHGARTAL